MNMCGVPACDRPADDATVCGGCIADLETALSGVAGLAEDLEVTVTRQARLGSRDGGRPAEVPLPYDPRASEAGWVLRHTLAGWVRELVEEA